LNHDDEINEKEEIIQINNYDAFGLNMEGNWNGANGANKYQYNGKEWNDDFGLGWNDYGARFYDPAMARWQTVDPLSEKMRRHSPYNYGFDNPMRFIDPDGMQSESVHVDDRGNVLKNYDDGDNSVYLHEGKTKKDVEKAYESSAATDAGGRKIGDLGGNIDISMIAANLLKDNKKSAQQMSRGGWIVRVLPGGIWDMKNNKKTIFGIAWAFDEKRLGAGTATEHTSFTSDKYTFSSAADFGNYHAGYTGVHSGLSRLEQYRWAGAGEVAKFNNMIERLGQMWEPRLPYGDRPVDYGWNTIGMDDADAEIKRDGRPLGSSTTKRCAEYGPNR
jgi:RHS repeat-associated protein